MTNLLRGPTIWFTELSAVRRLITEHPLGRRVAERFVAGDTLDAGMQAAAALRRDGIRAMLDHLGENVGSPAQAAEATDAYIRALKRIQEQPEIDCNISVKLTQLGLDSSTELCMENMERVLQAATRPDGATLLMIDMEASEYVERTIEAYLALRSRYSNVGVCIQSCLHRSEADVRRIAGPEAIVRMVKGAYLEPPDVAASARADISRRFALLSATLLASGSVVHFATHDPSLVQGAKRYVRSCRVPHARYEFQLLYGIRRDLQKALTRDGEPVRVYVPYGTSWYPYLTRRLAERPANVWFFISNALRRGG
jgi:proline dehydrogenase